MATLLQRGVLSFEMSTELIWTVSFLW